MAAARGGVSRLLISFCGSDDMMIARAVSSSMSRVVDHGSKSRLTQHARQTSVPQSMHGRGARSGRGPWIAGMWSWPPQGELSVRP